MLSSANVGERTLQPEIENELRPELPIAQRCKMLKELGDMHLHNITLDEVSEAEIVCLVFQLTKLFYCIQTSITKLWHLTNDLIVPNKPAETRQIALTFYKRLIHTQFKNLTLMREKFFLVIQNHETPEDLRHLLELLDTLTENGKNITNFEEKVRMPALLFETYYIIHILSTTTDREVHAALDTSNNRCESSVSVLGHIG